MKVLLLAPQAFFTQRGTPIAVKLLATNLADQGNEVDLLCFPFGADVQHPGLRIVRCGRFPGVRGVGIGWSFSKLLQDVMLVLTFVRMIRRHGPYDVVHAVEESVYPALALRAFHRARVVCDMDSSLAEQVLAKLPSLGFLRGVLFACERWAMRRADLVTPMCEELARQARAVRDDDAVVVLHDVPIAEPDGGTAADDLRACLHPGQLLALYVGNLERYQGIDLLLGAVTELRDDDALTTVVIGGADQDVARYRQRVRERGLEARLTFLGPRPLEALPALLGQADMLLSPRIAGGNTPMKIYSYMNSARPVVATRLSTHTQVLDDTTALLTEPTAQAFADGMRTLAADAALRDRLGTAARTRVETRYSVQHFRESLARAYRHVAPEKLSVVEDA